MAAPLSRGRARLSHGPAILEGVIEPSGGRAPARSYEWWAQAILEWFLPKLGADEMATLCVDREALAEASGDPRGVIELGQAVHSRLGPSASFRPILRATRTS